MKKLLNDKKKLIWVFYHSHIDSIVEKCEFCKTLAAPNNKLCLCQYLNWKMHLNLDTYYIFPSLNQILFICCKMSTKITLILVERSSSIFRPQLRILLNETFSTFGKEKLTNARKCMYLLLVLETQQAFSLIRESFSVLMYKKQKLLFSHFYGQIQVHGCNIIG